MPAELTYSPLVPWLGWHLGIYAVMAWIFAIAPVALFLMAWQLSGKPGWEFVAALVYSLASPDPRRLYVTLIWDEAPHQLALAMVWLAVTANPFKVTGALLFGLCWLAVIGDWRPMAHSVPGMIPLGAYAAAIEYPTVPWLRMEWGSTGGMDCGSGWWFRTERASSNCATRAVGLRGCSHCRHWAI